jgi:phage terminase large subunit-like protein
MSKKTKKKTYFEQALEYAHAVTDGHIVAGLYERLACKRFLSDLDRQNTPDFPYRFDAAAGARECRFVELLPHIKGEWARPKFVDGRLQYAKIKLEPWQIFAEIQIFGWLHVDTGLRRFRRAYEEVARKNAKSTRVAARDLFLLTADNEPGSQVYNAATTGEQAREVFDVARNMALREPDFLARFGVNVGRHDITIAETASSFKPLNSEGSTLDGLNVHGASIDELHAHKTRAVYDVIDTATGARAQPLISMITTAGSDRAGICYEQRDYSIKILTGVVVDETWFAVIYTLDDGDDWRDSKNWRKSNPNLGVSVKIDDMEAACRKALAMPSAQANFLTKRLNVWITSDSAWMDMTAWNKCADQTLDIERVSHLPCFIGLDLASKVDVAAKVLWFYDADADHHYLIPVFYLPERAVEQGRNSQYDGWRRGGHLQVTDGEVTDYDVIEDDLRADMAALMVREIPFDPWQATHLAGHMLSEGAPMVEYRQVVQNMSEPMKQFEALVLAGRLTHNANPMMTWMMSNVVCHVDAKSNIYPRKEREENKIDGAVAAIMALGRVIAQKPAKKPNDGTVFMV